MDLSSSRLKRELDKTLVVKIIPCVNGFHLVLKPVNGEEERYNFYSTDHVMIWLKAHLPVLLSNSRREVQNEQGDIHVPGE